MTELSIRSLTKMFGGIRAVDAISLTIGDGEFVSLLGPSGCGKTTTLKMIAGFEHADGGSIAFDGRDVGSLPAEKRDIGMVFQNYALFPHMTVAQNLAFGLEMRKLPKQEIRTRTSKVLDMVQLGNLPERYPRQLSGGQQQRVALARALVIEPRILLLDEPLANLDAKLRDEMRVFIRELQRRVGITTIYVTHDQAEAMTISDKVVVMFGGRIAQMGAPSDIYDRPISREVAGFVGRVNLIEGRISAIEAGSCRLRTGFGEIEIACPKVAVMDAALTVMLRPEAITLAPLSAASPGWAGKVLAAYYSGNTIDYRIELKDGTVLHVQTFPTQRFAKGDEVAVRASNGSFWPLGDAA
ncbi:putative spermidine/putrescine transport system ATP-binding protein [Rhizobiales bacterium GAS191]|nr:putative spermidine/putrescine transport system ATP-binding protein [Rhizobiales bacterium GAS191]